MDTGRHFVIAAQYNIMKSRLGITINLPSFSEKNTKTFHFDLKRIHLYTKQLFLKKLLTKKYTYHRIRKTIIPW